MEPENEKAQAMSDDSDIKWVTLTLNFSPEQEAYMETHAKAAGFSLECFLIELIFKHVPGDPQTEAWKQQLAATLRRNRCQ